MAFAKRIDELGFKVIPKDDPKNAERMAIAGSTALSDKEKFEALGLGKRPRTARPTSSTTSSRTRTSTP